MVEIPMVMAGAAAVQHLPPSLEAADQAEPDLARFCMELKDSLALARTAPSPGCAAPP